MFLFIKKKFFSKNANFFIIFLKNFFIWNFHIPNPNPIIFILSIFHF